MLWLLSSLSVIPVIAIPQLHSDRWVHPDPTSNLMFEHLTSNLMFEHPTRTNSHSWLSNRNIQLPYTGLPLLGLNQNKKDTFYQNPGTKTGLLDLTSTRTPLIFHSTTRQGHSNLLMCPPIRKVLSVPRIALRLGFSVYPLIETSYCALAYFILFQETIPLKSFFSASNK